MPHNQSREKGERRYTSIACLNCRRRKVKCNNEQPRCSNCRLYDNECTYGLDRRRTSAGTNAAAKAVVADDRHSKPLKTDAADDNDAAQAADDNLVNDQLLPAFIDSPSSNNEVSFGNVLLDQSGAGHDWSFWATPDAGLQLFSDAPFDVVQGFASEGHTYTARHDDHLRNLYTDSAIRAESPVSQDFSPPTKGAAFLVPGDSATYIDSDRRNARSPGSRPSLDFDNALQDVTKQLTSRLGRLQIAEDGRPRYYGATSNLHLLYSGTTSLTQPNIRHVLTHGDAAIAAAGLEWDGDQEYEKHLINLFFSWHNTLQFPVDKDIFRREQTRFRGGQRSELFTPSLENAIYCVGCAYTDRFHPGITGPTDEFFALRTKAYLDIEIDSPSVATAQAIMVLSSHEAAHTRESRGWIYMGMAVQICTDLGLHLDLEEEYSRLEKVFNAEEITTTRRNVFWLVKSIDTLWSAYSGRPSLMKNLVHNQKDPVPSKTYQWDHYVDEHSTMSLPADLDLKAAAHVHVHLASLMLILGRVAEVLYSGVPDISEDIQAFVSAADNDFQTWLANLPATVQLDLSRPFTVQGVLELHLIYHESVILLHRPLMTPADSMPSSESTPDRAAVSLNRCIDSANHICKILIYHRSKYGLKRLHHQMVHVAMTAALIHAFELCTRPVGSVENKNAQASFLTCIQALGEMGQTFKSASRALDVVTSLRQSWKDDASVGDRFKRARLR